MNNIAYEFDLFFNVCILINKNTDLLLVILYGKKNKNKEF